LISTTILENIRVLAVDQAVEEKGAQKVVLGKTATLEVTQSQAEALALARQQGTLSLTLRSLVDSKPGTPEAERTRSGTTINMLRYGVGGGSTTTASTASQSNH
jgi:pilus assembly protein CpaB